MGKFRNTKNKVDWLTAMLQDDSPCTPGMCISKSCTQSSVFELLCSDMLPLNLHNCFTDCPPEGCYDQ